MKNQIIKFICLLVVSACFLSFVGCNETTIYKTYPSFFGSDVTLVVKGANESEVEKAWEKVTERLDEIKLKFSADDTEENAVKSSGFNSIKNYNALKRGESVEVDFETYSIIEECRKLSEISSGKFNPCVRNLSDLWGFTPRFYSSDYKKTEKYDRDFNSVGGLNDPQSEYVQAFSDLADFSAVQSEKVNGKYYLKKNCPSVLVDGKEYVQQMDLSAVVKGYAADEIKQILSNIDGDFYISFGGSSMYLGELSGGAWNLKVTDPSSKIRSSLGSVSVKNTFVSTAGVYERKYYSESGELRHHIIDATTGKPVNTDILSVTLIGDDCSFSDGLSTALVALGKTESLKYLKNQSQYLYIVVSNDGQIFTNTDLCLEKDSPYTLVFCKNIENSD